MHMMIMFIPHVAVYAHGAVTVLTPTQPGIVYAANAGGTIGGSVPIDFTNQIEQAALFRGDRVELIPPQPGERTSFVTALNDSGMALVTSLDATDQPTYVLYRNGRTTVLDLRADRHPALRVPAYQQSGNHFWDGVQPPGDRRPRLSL